MNASPNRLLAIYLNDHLAGATAGVELCRRAAAANRDEEAFGDALGDLCTEIEADRETLRRLLEELGIRRDPVKPALAWVGEKLGRLKLNGRLTGYSPLSRLLELEALSIGIHGKQRLWESLQRSFGEGVAGFDFQALAERARRQQEQAEELHSVAAARALTSP